MNKKVLYLFLAICSLPVLKNAKAQSCPPNIDFEAGNYTNWVCESGVVTQGASITTFSNPVLVTPPGPNNQFTLTSGSGTDAVGGFPVVAPGAGTYSFKIKSEMNELAARITYKINIPTGVNQLKVHYQYAVVLDLTIHPSGEQARFEINAYDSATGSAITGAIRSFVAAPTAIPGFFTVSNTTVQAMYKPWTSDSLVVNNASGRTIYLQVSTLPCWMHQHRSWGYFDVDSCAQALTTTSVNETGNGNIVLYPNPTTGRITIRSIQGGAMTVRNMQGVTMAQVALNAGNNDVNLPEHLSTGIYLITITDSEDKSTIIKLLYNKGL